MATLTAEQVFECRTCGELKPFGDFYPRKTGRLKRTTNCRRCHTAAGKARRQARREEYNAAARRRRRDNPAAREYGKRYYAENGHRYRLSSRVGKYGLTVEDFEGMRWAQDNRCAICAEPAGDAELCIDHDHETGLVRGLLCHYCNRGIGQFREALHLVEAAAEYLRGAR